MRTCQILSATVSKYNQVRGRLTSSHCSTIRTAFVLTFSDFKVHFSCSAMEKCRNVLFCKFMKTL